KKTTSSFLSDMLYSAFIPTNFKNFIMPNSGIPSIILFMFILIAAGCSNRNMNESTMEEKLDKYTSFTLEADLSGLTENQQKMIPLLIEAADEMDKVFWLQAYGDKEELLSGLDENTQKYVQINYGPW